MKEKFNENAMKVGVGVALTGIFVMANPIVAAVGVGITAYALKRIFKPSH